MIGQYVTVHGDVISHLNISQAQVEDGGLYGCKATNRYSTMILHTMHKIASKTQGSLAGKVSLKCDIFLLQYLQLVYKLSTVRMPLSAALNKSRTPIENMLTFIFYFIFELKLHKKLW